MTVYALPARPGRQPPDTDAGPRPVPWQQMLWVTWRQHRGLLISVAVMFAAAMAAMLVEGLRIHHDYAVLQACHPAVSPACQQVANYFGTTDWHEGNGIHVAVQAFPVLFALFAGQPVVARELERNTFRYAWTQGVGRVRWTAAKLAIIGSVLTIAALAISQLFAWFFTPFLTTQNITALAPSVFDTRGIVYAAWTLTGFCLGAFLGMLMRRVLPAMAATLGSYAALTALSWFYLRDRYPVTTFWPMQLFETAWLLLLSALLITATVHLVRHHAT